MESFFLFSDSLVSVQFVRCSEQRAFKLTPFTATHIQLFTFAPYRLVPTDCVKKYVFLFERKKDKGDEKKKEKKKERKKEKKKRKKERKERKKEKKREKKERKIKSTRKTSMLTGSVKV